MRETTPLVAGDVEDPTRDSRRIAAERRASALALRVRAPATMVILALACAIVAAVHRHSDGFSQIIAAASTVKGIVVVASDSERLGKVGICDGAFTLATPSAEASVRGGDNSTTSAVSVTVLESMARSGVRRVYARTDDEDAACEVRGVDAAARVVCVDGKEVERCATNVGVLLPTTSLRERYVLATIIKHAQAGELEHFAYVDARLDGDGRERDVASSNAPIISNVDARALRVLVASDSWRAVRVQYDAHISVFKEVAASHGACPHRCRCSYAAGNLCKLHSNECELENDSAFMLRAEAYADVLARLPRADDGTSVLRDVSHQWLMVPPHQQNDHIGDVDDTSAMTASQTPSLGLPSSCVETLASDESKDRAEDAEDAEDALSSATDSSSTPLDDETAAVGNDVNANDDILAFEQLLQHTGPTDAGAAAQPPQFADTANAADAATEVDPFDVADTLTQTTTYTEEPANDMTAPEEVDQGGSWE